MNDKITMTRVRRVEEYILQDAELKTRLSKKTLTVKSKDQSHRCSESVIDVIKVMFSRQQDPNTSRKADILGAATDLLVKKTVTVPGDGDTAVPAAPAATPAKSGPIEYDPLMGIISLSLSLQQLVEHDKSEKRKKLVKELVEDATKDFQARQNQS